MTPTDQIEADPLNTPSVRHIEESIQAFYRKRLSFALLFILGILVLALLFPVQSILFPVQVTENDDPASLYDKDDLYIRTSLKGLYFTGYTRTFLGSTTGYYYYTMRDGTCQIVLLTPRSSEMGLSEIDYVTGDFRILAGSPALDKLLSDLSRDLRWTAPGIRDAISPYVLSEPDAGGPVILLLRILIPAGLILSGLSALFSAVAILCPWLSRPIRRLHVYGNPKKILRQAEGELSTLPQLATEDMFITEHFFIETSKYGVALIPIREIMWIYKYSTLHRFLWHHLSISYTLYIIGERRITIRCPKSAKSDIDGIMDYLAEANHEILVGFNEKNRRRVEARQGDLILLRKLWSFLSRKV